MGIAKEFFCVRLGQRTNRCTFLLFLNESLNFAAYNLRAPWAGEPTGLPSAVRFVNEKSLLQAIYMGLGHKRQPNYPEQTQNCCKIAE